MVMSASISMGEIAYNSQKVSLNSLEDGGDGKLRNL